MGFSTIWWVDIEVFCLVIQFSCLFHPIHNLVYSNFWSVDSDSSIHIFNDKELGLGFMFGFWFGVW